MPTTTATIEPRTKIAGVNHTDVQISKNPWNEPRIVAGGSTGGIFVKDAAQSDGWGLIDAVGAGQVFVSAGAATLPAWSASPTVTSIQVGTGVGVLFGGTSASFPALKRNGSALELRLADDSGFGQLSAQTLDVRGILQWGGNSQIYGGVDGKILLWNSAQTSFGLLQFGGTSASYPALKRNGATLEVRLADDSAYAVLRTDGGAGGTPGLLIGESNTGFYNNGTGRLYPIVQGASNTNFGGFGIDTNRIYVGANTGLAIAFNYNNIDDIGDQAVAGYRPRNVCAGTSVIIGTPQATTGMIRFAFPGSINVRDNANTGDFPMMAFDAAVNALFGSTFAVSVIRTNLNPPGGTIADGWWWVEFTGTTPNRQLRVAVRDGGVTYYQNIGALH